MLNIHKCPACQGQIRYSFDVHWDDFVMQVHQCRSCRSYVKSPFFDPQELSEIYKHYDLHEQVYEPGDWEKSNLVARLERIEKIKKPGILLEIGCGRGYFLLEALKRGWDVRGVELSGSSETHQIKGLEGKIDVVSSEADFQKLSNQKYDVVCSYQVFEHLMTPADSLHAWIQALHPKGLMVIQTPHAGSLGARLHRDLWIGHQRREHFTIFSEAGLRGLYQQFGLRIERVFFGGVPFPFTKVSREKAKKTSMPQLFQNRPGITLFLRNLVYSLGWGDNIEIFGTLQSASDR